MSLREKLSRMLATLRPWPSKAERKRGIADSRAQAEQARRKAERARRISEELQQMARNNHLAEAIARQIVEGRDGKT